MILPAFQDFFSLQLAQLIRQSGAVDVQIVRQLLTVEGNVEFGTVLSDRNGVEIG